ncbi:MAG: T9SS type A sorting domain-containing protein [Saprospiraceae bacterium]|nr:T9SS type A sorting domain-containing protein [Candidatus Vicinibacter affinis]
MSFDPAKLELVDIKSGALTVESYNYNHDMISNGKIRMSFDQASGVSFEKELFSFVFKAVGSGELSNSFALSNENFSSQAYGAQNDEINLKLSFLDSKSEVKGFYLYQNKPNPFSTYTDISFLLPESGLAVLKICDVNGKVIKQISREFKSGLNNIQINNKDLNQTGIFYYILETENNRAVKKMILIN